MTICPLIYLLDTSGSMSGSRIEKLNSIMKKTLDDLKYVTNGEEYVIKVSVLSFATCVQWIISDLTDIKELQWKSLDAYGMTSLGAAFKELEKKLCRDGLLKFEKDQHILRPIIILFTDGQPTDSYKYELIILKKNAWFSHALKFAIGIDSEIDRNVLIEFVENPICIIAEDDMELICQKINSISLLSTQYNIEHSTNNLLRSSIADSEEIMADVELDNESWA